MENFHFGDGGRAILWKFGRLGGGCNWFRVVLNDWLLY